jgi:hypothetical protein
MPVNADSDTWWGVLVGESLHFGTLLGKLKKLEAVPGSIKV